MILQPLTFPTTDPSMALRFADHEERDMFVAWWNAVGEPSLRAWLAMRPTPDSGDGLWSEPLHEDD